MSYYCDDSSKHDYEQDEEECEWDEEEFPYFNNYYNFIRDKGYSYDPLYYEDVCSKPPQATPMDELEILRETCKTLPQQYQAYINVMGEASKPYPLEDCAQWVFGYMPNSENVESLKKNNPTC